MKPLRVHILYQHGRDLRPFGCSYIRLLLPLAHPACQEAFTVTHGLDYQSADVVIVERTWRPWITVRMAEDLVARVRRDRVRLVYTIDDNLLDLPDFTNPVGLCSVTTEERIVIRLFVREANGVIVSTEGLKDRLSHLNSRIAVVQNSLDERLFGEALRRKPTASRDRSMTIGFMGTPTHDADIMMILQPLREALREYRGKLELQVVGGLGDPATMRAFEGLPFKILDVGAHVQYPLFVRWMIENLRWDLAVAPLEDNPFTRCKSDLKFLDYSALGIPGIYSRLPPYEGTVRHLDTGYLTDNTPEAWAEGLVRLLTDDDLRLRLAANARRYVMASRTLQQRAGDWLGALQTLIEREAAEPAARITEQRNQP